MKERRFSSEFKARVTLEAIKGQRTANELAQEFGVHYMRSSQSEALVWGDTEPGFKGLLKALLPELVGQIP